VNRSKQYSEKCWTHRKHQTPRKVRTHGT